MLSENLKYYRENKGYSKLKLARETGLSARCIEHKNPRTFTLEKIANVLGISVDSLIR